VRPEHYKTKAISNEVSTEAYRKKVMLAFALDPRIRNILDVFLDTPAPGEPAFVLTVSGSGCYRCTLTADGVDPKWIPISVDKTMTRKQIALNLFQSMQELSVRKK